MRFHNFTQLAHPPLRAAAESNKGLLWRSARWLGVRTAFVFWCLGISGNMVSVLAVLVGVGALALVLWSASLPAWTSALIVVCCYGSIFLDFCDGPLARAAGKAGRLGKVLDGIATDLIRAGLPLALGAIAGPRVFLLLGAISGHFIVFVRNQFIWDGISFDTRAHTGALARLVCRAFSVVVMLGLLPPLIAIAWVLDVLRPFSQLVVSAYALLALLWFCCACLQADRAQTNTAD